jgi:hypothetical protein
MTVGLNGNIHLLPTIIEPRGPVLNVNYIAIHGGDRTLFEARPSLRRSPTGNFRH